MPIRSQVFSQLPQDIQSVLEYTTSSIPAPPISVQEALAEWALIHLSITLESSIRDKFHTLARWCQWVVAMSWLNASVGVR